MIASISTCLIIYLCSLKAELSPWFVGLSICIGISIHLIHSAIQTKLKNLKKSHFLFLLPLIALVFLIFNLPNQQQLFLSIQCLGFSLLGFFIVTLYENRAPR